MEGVQTLWKENEVY